MIVVAMGIGTAFISDLGAEFVAVDLKSNKQGRVTAQRRLISRVTRENSADAPPIA